MCVIVFGYYYKAGCKLVYPVYYARAHFAAYAGKVLYMIHYGVHKSACFVTGRRVNHHALRLIYNGNVTVLIYYRQRYIFCGKFGACGKGYKQFNCVPSLQLCTCLCLILAVYAGLTFVNKPPGAVAFIVRPYSLYSIIGKLGCSIAVYSFSSLLVFFFLSRLSINVLPLKKSTSIINIAAPMHIALSATLKTGKSISLK